MLNRYPPDARPATAMMHTEKGAHALAVTLADTFGKRLRGLMLAKSLEPDQALLITQCPSVHTAFMRFAIDVVYLDDYGNVLKCVPDLKPWRASVGGAGRDRHGRRHVRASHTLELAAGTIRRLGIAPGDRLAHPLFGTGEKEQTPREMREAPGHEPMRMLRAAAGRQRGVAMIEYAVTGPILNLLLPVFRRPPYSGKYEMIQTSRRMQVARILFALGLVLGLTPTRAELPFPGGDACDPGKQSCAGPGPGPGPGPGSSCGPGPGGATCGGAAVASQGNTSGTNLGAGNPINLITGNKYQKETDLPALPGVLGLEIVRHYNSAYAGSGSANGILGRGWKLSYETELYAIGRTIQIVQADGTRLIFTRNADDPSQCGSADPARGRIAIRHTTRGEEYLWTWSDGRKLSFNSQGKLEQIQAPSGEFVSLQYDAQGLLLKVTDPQGRQLRLIYPDRRQARQGDTFRGVQAIDSPLGRFRYEYGSEPPPGAASAAARVAANLVKVNLPTHYDGNQKPHAYSGRGLTSSSISRLYHYEDPRHPTLLTGITASGAGSDGQLLHQRLATYAYDLDGKAIESTHADGVNRVGLDYRQGGQTILTNSLGQKTIYRHAIVGGEHRLLEVRGAGCALCGQTNVRYGYDRLGRLIETTRLDEKGQPLDGIRRRLDGQGRPLRVERIDYRDGRAQPARRLVRYGYQASWPQPAWIARPSVVPGREHQIRIVYNDWGQPQQVTESGWTPALDGKEAATPIERTTTYGYRDINGRSVLTRIDGPLPNGPKASPEDSDVTTLEYDQRGSLLVSITRPGGDKSTVTYDDAGRIAAVRNAQGFQTAFGFDAMQLTRISSSGPGWAKPRIQSFQYDALGQHIETGTGQPEDDGYRAQTRQAFDGAGRLLWRASALGILQQNRFDTESHLIESGRYGAGMAQVQHYAYDHLGRLSAAWNDGGAGYAIDYDARGGLERVTDALGRVSSPPGAARRPPANAGPRQYRDDFGRIVATVSADGGATSRVFDAADRLIASSDANGNRATYEYDAQGRIRRQTITDAATGQDSLTRWQYQGNRLIALEHPSQSERYGYDQRGLRTSKTVILKTAASNGQTDPGGQAIAGTTRYAYDDHGALHSSSLPDGTLLVYQRNGQGQVTAIRRSRIQTGWLQWLLPATPLASDLERDLVGLSGYTAGNGIQARFQRSQQGILARVTYRNSRTPARPAVAGAAGPGLPWPPGPQTREILARMLGMGNAQAATAPAPGNTADPKPLPGALGLPADPQALLDQRYLWDAAGNLLYRQDRAGAQSRASYAYDRRNRLIVASQIDDADGAKTEASASRYYYAVDRRLLSQEGIADQSDLTSRTRRARYERGSHRWLGDDATDSRATATVWARYDANGWPRRIGRREYVWDALGRLTAVREEDRTLARYAYNHRGERIGKVIPANPAQATAGKPRATYYLYEGRQLAAELNHEGRITRQYVYLADQPVAVIDTPAGKALFHPGQSRFARLGQDAGTILQAWWQAITGRAGDERIVWLHANHLGAPQAATDPAGQVIWQAGYHAFGQARIVTASLGEEAFTLNLRLPGQYYDAETGLHYNRQRYYDPGRGEYLTPDPLGNPDGPNPYSYVRYNPLKYVDPDGLVLFAFDGTGNDESDPNTLSNVVRFRNLYEDEQYYITGPGTRDPVTGIENPLYRGGNPADVIESFTGKERIAAMIDRLNEYSDDFDDDTAFDIDIIGFSRGAAQARDFANQIVEHYSNGYYQYIDKQGNQRCQKMSFRFMGLFDTVLSEHTGSYALGIPDIFQYVAQAVALNEYRGGLISFPLESISGVPVSNDRTRIERGFLGSHSDIGGGFPDQDLAKVALTWMVDQAIAAGVKMNDDPSLHTITANPVLHDKSGNLLNGAPDGGPTTTSEDREVRYLDGTVSKQRSANTFGMSWADTQQFIAYKSDPNTIDDISGTVDMMRYLQWLNEHGYGINMTIQ